MASNSDNASCTCGHIQVEVVTGDLAAETADVIMCTTTKDLALRRGQVSRALLMAAGEILQQDCDTGYPDGIQYEEVAVVHAGNLKCKRVFLVALPVYCKSQQDQKILEGTIIRCLEVAHEHNISSVALPVLGTGQLRYPSELVAKTTLCCIKQFSKSHPKSPIKRVRVVVYVKDTDAFQAFQTEIGSDSTGNNGAQASFKELHVLNNHKVQLPPRLANMSLSDLGMGSIISGRTEAEDTSTGPIDICVVVGKFPSEQVKADVFVNIMRSNQKIVTGTLGRALLEAAGEEMQIYFNHHYETGLKPGQVEYTRTYQLRQFKKICHCYLKQSEKLFNTTKSLQKVVEKCLEKTCHEGFKSVLIPAPAIEKLSDEECAGIICHTIRSFEDETKKNSIRKIIIFIEKERNCDEKEAIYKRAIEKALKSIENKKQEVSSDYWYKSLETAFKGALERVDKGPNRGTNDWFKFMYKKEPRTPPYWSQFNSVKTIKEWHMGCGDVKVSIVPVERGHFAQIEKLVQDTWQSQHVGHGRDSAGLADLGYNGIKVTKVERIENTMLYEKYINTRQELFRKIIRKGSFHQLKDIPNSKGAILTTESIGSDGVLTEDIYLEVNEHYMFHGTQDAIVNVIAEQGLDSRLAGSSSMFGQGVYAAESSTKADQYSDTKDSRSKINRKMFLIRMCLGKIHLQSQAQTFARPPCSGCSQARCSCGANNYCDSVVGDGSWIFREFIVYDRSQVYPEYIITYNRI